MNSTRNWTLLLAGAMLWLGGCAHKPVPCPPVVEPPPRLMTPPESPVTRERLERLLPPISQPASATPNGSGSSSGG